MSESFPVPRIPVVIYDKKEIHNEFIRLMKRMDYRYLLKMKKEENITMLVDSLQKEGRIYGAEWQEEEELMITNE